eukprot:399814_1
MSVTKVLLKYLEEHEDLPTNACILVAYSKHTITWWDAHEIIVTYIYEAASKFSEFNEIYKKISNKCKQISYKNNDNIHVNETCHKYTDEKQELPYIIDEIDTNKPIDLEIIDDIPNNTKCLNNENQIRLETNLSLIKAPVKQKYAVVVIGTTGTGKSSLIELFCGEKNSFSHDTLEPLELAEIFQEIGDNRNENRVWVDTIGTDDNKTNETILEQIIHQLQSYNVTCITVLWCVSGDFTRQKGEYIRQAKCIKSLQTGSQTTNIWKSVLMVQKMGTLQPKWNKIQGIVNAAKNYGANMYVDEDTVKDHIVGFKCIELINLKGDDPMYEILVDAGTSQDKLMQLGYVTKTQMKSTLMDKLKNIDYFPIDYEGFI